MHDSEQEHSGITGCRVTYESTIFYNEANKFSIIVVKTSDPRIPPQACSGRYYGDRMLRFTAVGYELPRTKAVELELDGEWVESKYGYQLQVEQWQEIVPQTADGLLAYLGSGLIKGIGPKTAEDIVATFGPDTLNILDNEPEKLLQIRGITEGKLKDIEESYAESRVLRNLMSLLGPFKITPATALKIYQNFGPACVDILKNCPYDLCQISGFGFKRVDGIVRKTDNRLHSAERIKGAVLYTLEDARGKSGHLFLPSEDLVKETLLLLNAPIPIPEQRVRAEEVQETLQQMILHGAVVAYKQYLYSPRVFGQEDDTARMIAERLANISVAENIESALESVRESLGITLSQKQEQAVRTAFRHGLTIITGSPGTGKTTVLKAIIEVFKNLHPKGKFALMAPTGRASRRMAESTGVDEARTLHSALGLGTGEEVGDGERVRFVDADLVIVDEFSMVDMWLAQQFFKRIVQHTRVVLVGDPNQLPSVGAGNVFYELIHSGMVPVTVLDWIFRQSKDGLIAYNAKFINEGSTKLYYGNDFVFVDSPTQIETARRIQDIYCKEAAERGIENVQILSPFREKGEAASEQLNRAIRERVNPFRSAEEEVKIGSRIFRVHDRVMQTKNTEKVSNGDLGFITGITTNSKGERLVQMDFGGDRKLTYTPEQLAHVDLAYATTIHKAMGSEFETVIIPIVKAHTIMLYRNLLYTAVTRAKKKVILVGHMMNRDVEDDAFEVSSDSETVDSFSEEFEPVEPPKQEPQAEDAEEARKKAEFDAAEAKRKAEWEAKQAQKKLREQQELDRLAAMSDDDVMQASMNRVSQDTERLTRRNMKLCVMEDVQTECLADPAFARLVMNPKKKMLNCFHYINRKAREYLEQEMKDNDEKPMGGGFGGDVPDELCYQWAREYFRDAEAKEDAEPEEKFVPKTYNGKMPKAGKVKKDKPKKWCCTIKVDIENSKGQYIEKDKQEATKDGSESTKIQHGI